LIDNLEFEDYSVIEYRYPLSGWRDQLIKVIKNGVEENFEYDALGNPTTYRGNSLSWSCGRQLDEFGENISYKYNLSGIRTSKTVGDKTTKYYLNGNKIVRQETGDETMDFFYGVNGLCGFSLNGQNYTYKKNAQNDIIGIYDSTGKQIVKYDYDAWGVQTLSYFVEECDMYAPLDVNAYTDNSNINQYVALHNPFRYRSYYYDTETGLYYLNSRYYDPELGRFINADDISLLNDLKDEINGLNLYVYCLNNPINDYDDNGCWSWKRFWKVIGAILVVTLVTAAVVLTAGTAAVALGASAAVVSAVVTGAAIGGLVAGGLEIINQITTNGIDNMNFTSIVIETFGGAAIGALSGLGGSTVNAAARVASRTAKIAVSGLTAMLHGINDGKGYNETLNSVAKSMGFTALLHFSLVGADALSGKLSSSTLQHLSGIGLLTFGLAEKTLVAGIRGLVGIWNHFKDLIFGN